MRRAPDFDGTAHEYLMAIYRGEIPADPAQRMQAAANAVKYEKPALAAVAWHRRVSAPHRSARSRGRVKSIRELAAQTRTNPPVIVGVAEPAHDPAHSPQPASFSRAVTAPGNDPLKPNLPRGGMPATGYDRARASASSRSFMPVRARCSWSGETMTSGAAMEMLKGCSAYEWHQCRIALCCPNGRMRRSDFCMGLVPSSLPPSGPPLARTHADLPG
jgi:hypothetical protein